MIRQKVYIPRADWHVKIFYDAKPANADEILDVLWDLGCEQRHLYKAEKLLRSGVDNEGLTFSNPYERESVVVVGHTSNLFEIFSTIFHELDHLQIAICRADGLKPDGEDAAYLMGDITEAIARNAYYTMRSLFLYLI